VGGVLTKLFVLINSSDNDCTVLAVRDVGIQGTFAS